MSASAASTRIGAMTTTATLLLISTFAAVGLDALAASLAPGHWFKRVLAFLVAPGLLLLIPAFEPFLVLVLEGSVVALGVKLWRRRQAQELESSRRAAGLRFGLETLLCVMALCGVAAAVAVRFPANNREGWQSIFVVGIVVGMATLLGAWAATRAWWLSFPALVLALLLSVAPMLGDWFIDSVSIGQWPPDPPTAANPFSLLPDDLGPETTWLLVIPATTLIVSLSVRLTRSFRRSDRHGIRRYASGVAAAVFALAAATPAAAVLFLLLTPEPIPRAELPQPNGYLELVEAGRLSESTLANSANFDPDTATPREFEQAATEAAPALALAREAFSRECLAPVGYTSVDDLPMESIKMLRNLGRAMSATGRFHAGRGEMNAALVTYLDIVQVGVDSRRGGLLVDAIIGMANVGAGQKGIHHIVGQLSPTQCRSTIARIVELRDECEPFAAFERRDRIWTAHAMGWAGRLQQILDDVEKFERVGFIADLLPDDLSFPFKRERACTELLLAELALHAFVVEQGRLPTAWEEVVASGSAALGVDSLDPAGGPLRFVLKNNKPVLYSVGPNGSDDDGIPPSDGEFYWDQPEGDLRLDVIWAADVAQAALAAGAPASLDLEPESAEVGANAE
jgi:hypothetical protein